MVVRSGAVRQSVSPSFDSAKPVQRLANGACRLSTCFAYTTIVCPGSSVSFPKMYFPGSVVRSDRPYPSSSSAVSPIFCSSIQSGAPSASTGSDSRLLLTTSEITSAGSSRRAAAGLAPHDENSNAAASPARIKTVPPTFRPPGFVMPLSILLWFHRTLSPPHRCARTLPKDGSRCRCA